MATTSPTTRKVFNARLADRWPEPVDRFIWTPATYPILYGGVRSGKTTGLCARGLVYSLAYPGNRGLLARYTLGEANDTLLEEWKKLVPEDLYEITPDKWGWVITVRTPGPSSTILIRPLQDEFKFQSLELGWFGISQLDEPHLTIGTWDMLTSRLTWQLPTGYGVREVDPETGDVAWRPRYTGFGEANSGSQWIIDLWGPNRTHQMPGYEAHEVSIYDNRHNLPASYLADMEAKPEYWRRWYLLPCWEPLTIPDGTPVFKDYFDFVRHVSTERVTPQSGWPIIRGWDAPGPIATVWFQVDQQNDCRVLFEHLAHQGMSVADVKQAVLAQSELLFPGFSMTDMTDPPAINTKSPTDQKTIADLLRPEILMQPGEPTLSGRLEAGRTWLGKSRAGHAVVRIDPRCRQLIGALQYGYVWRKQAGQDLPEPIKNTSSHLIDAWLHALGKVTVLSPRRQRDLLGRGFGPP